MSGAVYGYVRVSSADQNEDRQMIAMREKGVAEENIYVDKISGKDFNRPMYKKLMRKVRMGDLIYIKSIDRLGRSYEDINEQWRILTKEKQVDIAVIDMENLDTRVHKNLLGTFVSDVFLQVLSFVAENERMNIRQRQREGIEAARLRGVHMGRPAKQLPQNFEQALGRWLAHELSGREAAKLCGLPLSTFYRKSKEMQKNQPRQ